ncbi:MAG: CRISPR-associated protein Cas4 [Phaeodactylibacter sp.]|uniref:CRISPR-associated protein Cas4 n=1 Tax=Phaeodactylibacter sp. TaxID=1940289 RepID=UPI0032EF89A0
MLSLTPSQIIEYLYCPRFTYYEYVLQIPQHEEKYYKVMRGRELHMEKARHNVEYLRRRIGVTEKRLNQYLTNDLLRGEVDEVLWLKDGTMAPLDYKFARYEEKIYETYKTQLYCYAWLIRENFGLEVERGYLVYTRSRNQLVEVPIDPSHISVVKKAANEISRIISQNFFPKATKYKRRCVNCTYRNICIQ